MRTWGRLAPVGAIVRDEHVAVTVKGRFEGKALVVVVTAVGLPSLSSSIVSELDPGEGDSDGDPPFAGCSGCAVTVIDPSGFTVTVTAVPSSASAKTTVAFFVPAVTTTVAPRGTSALNVSFAWPFASSVPVATFLS